MLVGAAHTDWGAIAAFVGVGVILLGGLVRLLVSVAQLTTKVDQLSSDAQRNARHLDSLLNSWWLILMRVTTLEEFLQDTADYRPPSMVPDPREQDR